MNIRDQDVKRFLLRNIVMIFGILNTLILDKGLHFDSKAFRRHCCDLDIKNKYSAPAYPQGIGQEGATNRVIVDGLKKRLEEVKGKWVDELPQALWMYRTTLGRSTRETPFSMTYGSEVIILLETGFLTMKYDQFNSSSNEQLLSTNLD